LVETELSLPDDGSIIPKNRVCIDKSYLIVDCDIYKNEEISCLKCIDGKTYKKDKTQ
jgi:hypothetical protein